MWPFHKPVKPSSRKMAKSVCSVPEYRAPLMFEIGSICSCRRTFEQSSGWVNALVTHPLNAPANGAFMLFTHDKFCSCRSIVCCLPGHSSNECHLLACHPKRKRRQTNAINVSVLGQQERKEVKIADENRIFSWLWTRVKEKSRLRLASHHFDAVFGFFNKLGRCAIRYCI